jgi:hypothetical protein
VSMVIRRLSDCALLVRWVDEGATIPVYARCASFAQFVSKSRVDFIDEFPAREEAGTPGILQVRHRDPAVQDVSCICWAEVIITRHCIGFQLPFHHYLAPLNPIWWNP